MLPQHQERPSEASPVFHLGRVPVFIQPGFFLVTALFAASSDLSRVLIWIAVCFVSVLVHEFGHAWVIRRHGGTPAILLYSGGGLTFGNTRDTPWRSMLVSLAGPMAGFLFAGLIAALAHAMPPAGKLQVAYRDLLYANLFWGAINLLPMLPLDGGNIFEAMIELRWPRHSRLVAELATAITSLLTVSIALYLSWYWMALFTILWTMSTYSALLVRYKRRRDREVIARCSEIAAHRHKGETEQAATLGRQLLAAAHNEVGRSEVANELALTLLDLGDKKGASDLLAQHLRGADVPRAVLFASALQENGATVLIERLEQEANQTDSTDLFGVFLDACAELDDLDRGVRVVLAHDPLQLPFSALIRRGTVHFYQRRYEQTLKLCEIGTLAFPGVGVFPYNAACSLAHLARHDEAFRALEVALEASDDTIVGLETDPDLKSLHTDERWTHLLTRVSARSPSP